MTVYQIFNLLFAASLPFVVLAVVGRHVLSAFRSVKNREPKFLLLSVLAITGMMLLFAGVAVVWFGYGVGHSKKDVWSDLILFSVSAAPIYGGGYGLWRLARFIDYKTSGGAA